MNVKIENEVIEKLLKERLDAINVDEIFKKAIEKQALIRTGNLSIPEKKISTWVRDRLARVIDRDYVNDIVIKNNMSKAALVDAVIKKTHFDESIESYCKLFVNKLVAKILNNK